MPRCESESLAGDRPGEAGTTPAEPAAVAPDPASGGAQPSAPSRRELKLAAVYARVSSDYQEKQETVESQRDALLRAAQERGYDVPPEFVFVDEGFSGARLDRPALDRLRDLAAESAFDTVLICSPDRLARQYAYQVLLVDELKRAGVELVFLNHAFDDSPEQKMLLQVQGVFAEYEREVFKERCRRGRLYAARQGRYVASSAPYGYRYIPRTDATYARVEIDEKEAEIVRQIFRWLVEEHVTSNAMARRLQGLSVPRRRGGVWKSTMVIEILKDTSYKGEGYYNRTMVADAQKVKGKRTLKDLRPGNRLSFRFRPREEWIPVRMPVIIDPETWELAQEQLKKNSQFSKRNNKRHDYLLRSLLICGRCGRRLIGRPDPRPGKKDYWRYICTGRYPRTRPDSCGGRNVPGPSTEWQVWEAVQRLLSDPELLKAQYEQGRGDPAIEPREEQERARIERKLKALDREIQRLIDAYQAEAIELPELQERRTRLDEHGRLLREQVQQIQTKRLDREQELRMLEGVEAFCASVRDALQEPSFEVKQKILQLVVDKIVVEEDRLAIHHVVPVSAVFIENATRTRF